MDDFIKMDKQINIVDDKEIIEKIIKQRKSHTLIRKVFGWFKFNSVYNKQRKQKALKIIEKSVFYHLKLALFNWKART